MARTRKIVKSSVHRALNQIGDRWSQLIIQEAFRGASRFEEFRARTNAPRNTLSSRLRGLVANGILEQRAAKEGGARQSYHLTPMGLDLYDSVLIAWTWGIRWDATAPNGPAGLIHTECGKPMLPTMVCRHCGGDISLHTCSHHPGPGAGYEEVEIARLHRRRQSGAEDAPRQAADVVDMTGDRWTGLVISTQYFGIHRFDDIQSALEIATNILTDRLRVLVANGVFERRLYEMSPPRYEYWLTKKGKDLYPHALALLLWAEKWLLKPGEEPPIIVTHRQCEQPVDAAVVCSECRKPLTPENVTERRVKDRKAVA